MIINNERRRNYEKEASEKTKEIIISKDILDLIQGSLYYSKKKGRAFCNIKPKDYGNLPKRKRRLSEIEEYEGDKHEISVFNTDRESKRLMQIDTNSKGARKEAMINIRRPLTDQDPFKKNDRSQS